MSAVALTVALMPAAGAQEGASGATTEVDGPAQQYPFACTAQDHGLELIVDNQDGEGVEVFDEDGERIGWSRDCETDTRTWYYAVDQDGQRHVVREDGEEAIGGDLDDIEERMEGDAEIATTTLTDDREVPYLIRHERGTINRFIYSVSMLTTAEEITEGEPDEPAHEHWNGRLLFQFQGGVGIGHSQGRYDDRGITGRPDRLAKGYAVIYSTATRTGDHYNLLVGGRTAEQVKDHFVDVHGAPDYTVGLGSSGGGIQQYVYPQNHPDLLDAAIPQHSYPDMTTQTIHVGDCALLDRWMDLEAEDAEFWADWDNRQLLQGLNSIEGYLGSTARGLNGARDLLESQFGIDRPRQTGSSECLEGWLGLLPLSMNPLFGSESNWDLLGDQVDDIERTHWSDVREAYGTDPDTGFARVAWDNVGVQYGLSALREGAISAEQFLDLNAQVGSWKEPEDMVEEAVPFESDPEVVIGRIAQERQIPPEEVMQGLASGDIPFTELFDPWSSRNAVLSPDGGETPAPRRSGDLGAIAGAHESGLVFGGELERAIPMIDFREYLEPVLDMHNTHQSFAARQRMIEAQGHHDGQVVWFVDTEDGDAPAADDVVHTAFDTIAEWIDNLDADPELSVTDAAPDAGVDSCFALDGAPIAVGAGVWDGILDDADDGACTSQFETFTTSRIEAGAPITGDVYKCHTMPVATALHEGLYGDWSLSSADLARLEAIHPEGVCDYDLRGQADPRGDVPPAVTAASGTDALQISDARPGAEIEVRAAGEVVATATASSDGSVRVALDEGTYVVAQRADGQRGVLSAPVQVTGMPFSDVDPDSAHASAILRLAERGILRGRPDGTYRPSEDLSRGQMASVVARAFGLDPVAEGPFPDVDPSGVHAGAINALAEAGIVAGKSDGLFHLHDGVTRGQLSSMLVRASTIEEGSGSHFPDVEGSVHEGAIYGLADAGVIRGYQDGTFRPGVVVNRAQAATFVIGVLDVVEAD